MIIVIYLHSPVLCLEKKNLQNSMESKSNREGFPLFTGFTCDSLYFPMKMKKIVLQSLNAGESPEVHGFKLPGSVAYVFT